MRRRQHDPVRARTAEERATLERVSRAQRAPAVQVTRATVGLAVAAGLRDTAAAPAVGRRSTAAVSHHARRCNQAGRAALDLRHSGGPAMVAGVADRNGSCAPASIHRIVSRTARHRGRCRHGTMRCVEPQMVCRASVPVPSWLGCTTLACAGNATAVGEPGPVGRMRTAGAVSVRHADAHATTACLRRRMGTFRRWAWQVTY